MSVCLNFLRTLVIRRGPTLIQCDLLLTWSHMPRSYFQIRSHSHGAVVRISTYLFEGHNLTHHKYREKKLSGRTGDREWWVLPCQGGLWEEVSQKQEPKWKEETLWGHLGPSRDPEEEACCKAPPAFLTPGNYETVYVGGLSHWVLWKCVHSNR